MKSQIKNSRQTRLNLSEFLHDDQLHRETDHGLQINIQIVNKRTCINTSKLYNNEL